MAKAVSTVIATLLMLVITIALVGFAYSYLSSTATSRTSVVLGILKATCTGDTISVTVRNEGTSPSGTITVTATQPDGTTAGGSCTISAVNAGSDGSCDVNRPLNAIVGTYSLSISSPGAAPGTGVASCSTVGV